jgi:hypothetical protein
LKVNTDRSRLCSVSPFFFFFFSLFFSLFFPPLVSAPILLGDFQNDPGADLPLGGDVRNLKMVEEAPLEVFFFFFFLLFFF